VLPVSVLHDENFPIWILSSNIVIWRQISVGNTRSPRRLRPVSIPTINSHPIDPQFHQILAANPSSALHRCHTAMPQPRPNQRRVDLLQALTPPLEQSSLPEEHRRLPSMTASSTQDTPSSPAGVAACHSLEVRKTGSPHCPSHVGGSPVEN
jgi:hypothetical protein